MSQSGLCKKCFQRPAEGMYSDKNSISIPICYQCLSTLNPAASMAINNMINQHTKIKNQSVSKSDRRNLVSYETFVEIPEIQLIFCEKCNFFPISHLPTLGKPYCKRCGSKFRMTIFPLKSLPIDSYILNKNQN